MNPDPQLWKAPYLAVIAGRQQACSTAALYQENKVA
jgi:hypothetical protein